MFATIKRDSINGGVKACTETAGAWLLDTREEDEYQQGHVPASRNVTITQLERITSLVHDLSTPLFVYNSTAERSSVAAKRLRLMGFSDITDLGSVDDYAGELE